MRRRAQHRLSLSRRNLRLSVAIALTGSLAPILFSLIVLHIGFKYTLLQAFTAGAALSSTSLGTTFSVISQAGYGKTRLGAVLTSAAITDDVVSLILLQVVVSLGSITTSSSLEARNGASEIGWAVGQPLLASLGMLGVSWAMLQWVVGPAYAWMTGKLSVIKARQAHAYNVSSGVRQWARVSLMWDAALVASDGPSSFVRLCRRGVRIWQ